MTVTSRMFLSCAAAALVAAVPLRGSSAAPALSYKTAPGDELVYRLDYRSNSELNFSGLVKADGDDESPPQKIRVAIKGNLAVTAVAQQDGQTTVALQLRDGNVSIASNGDALEDQAAAVRDGLATAVIAQVDARGRILGLRFDDKLTPQVQLAARALYALLQVVLPEGDAAPKRWETQETEPNGDYTAKYAQAGAGSGATRKIRKRKVAFAEEAPSGGTHEIAVQKTIRPRGSLAIQFDVANGRVAGIAGEDIEEILLNGRSVGVADVKLKLSLAKAGKADVAPLQQVAQARASGKLASLKTVESKEAVETSIQQNELKTASADQIWADLAKLEETGGDDQPLYLKVKALLTVQPQQAAKAGELLGKAKADGPTVRILSGALGTVGNAECQAALAAAAKARPPDDAALSAILPAMGELARPLPVAEDTLRSMATSDSEGDGASTARLALGTMASTLAKIEPERAKKIVADLAGVFDKTPSEEVKRQILLALGNSASADAVATLVKAAADKSAILREAAAKAAGQIKTPETDKLLAQAKKDDDEHVRKAAADALANRKKD